MNVTTLWDSIEKYLGAESVELDDLRWSGRVLKITVDAEGGVDIDRIAELARGISRLLDDDPTIEETYTLEVGSPGLERELRRPSHFIKALGREVKVITLQEVAGETSHRGTLSAYDESAATITVEGADRLIPLELIKLARTVFNWDKAAKPGSKKQTKNEKVS